MAGRQTFGSSEDDNLLGTILLIGLAWLALAGEGAREWFFGGGGGPLLGALGIGYLPALLALTLLFGASIAPASGRVLLTLAGGIGLLALAGALSGQAPALAALVRVLLLGGVLLGLRALMDPVRRLAGVQADRYEPIRFRLLSAWLLYGALTFPAGLLGMLHLGVAGLLLWQVIPAVAEGWQRLSRSLRGLFAPASEPMEFEPADPVARFTPEQEEVMARIIDFVTQNYNTGSAEKWPNPRITDVFEAPGYTTYVLELPMTFSGRTLIQRIADLAVALLIDEERLNIMTGGEQGGLLIQISKTDEQKRASTAWYDDVVAQYGPMLADKPYEVVLGLNEFGQPIITDLSDLTNPHLLLAGRAGSGKSQMLHNILAQLLNKNSPERLEFIFVDPKGVTGNFYARARLPHLVDALIEEDAIVSEGPEVLKRAAGEQDRRQKILMEAGVGNVAEYNRQFPDKALSLYLLVIDEAQDLADSPNDNLKNAYAEYVGAIARKGRSNWVRLVIGVQKPTQKAVGDFRLNLTRRIVMRLDKNGSPLALDDNSDMSATKLSGKGDAFYVDEDLKRRFNSAYLPENEDERRPGLSLVGELHRAAERWGPRELDRQATQQTSAQSETIRRRIAAEHNAKCTDREWIIIQGLRLAVASAQEDYDYLPFTPEALMPFVTRAAEGYSYSDKPFSAEEIHRTLGKFYPDRNGAVPKSRDWTFCRAMIESSKFDPGLVGLYAPDPSLDGSEPAEADEAPLPDIDTVASRTRRDP